MMTSKLEALRETIKEATAQIEALTAKKVSLYSGQAVLVSDGRSTPQAPRIYVGNNRAGFACGYKEPPIRWDNIIANPDAINQWGPWDCDAGLDEPEGWGLILFDDGSAVYSDFDLWNWKRNTEKSIVEFMRVTKPVREPGDES